MEHVRASGLIEIVEDPKPKPINNWCQVEEAFFNLIEELALGCESEGKTLSCMFHRDACVGVTVTHKGKRFQMRCIGCHPEDWVNTIKALM